MKLPFTLASRFVAGETFEEAVPKVKALNEKSIQTTLDLLGENVTDRETAEATVDDYIRLLMQIDGSVIASSISIKLTMIGLDISKEFCRQNLFRLLDEAVRLDQFVRIDMEGSEYTVATLDLFREAYTHYGAHVGIVLQASLHRTRDDVLELAGSGADIRLCKGAYKEPEKIALQKMTDIRKAFLDYSRILLEKTSFPRFATHDDELIEQIKSYAAERSLKRDRFEFQMLFGLREETMTELAAEGYRARVYVPFGTMWLPYFKRRLTERKENLWFVLSTMFRR